MSVEVFLASSSSLISVKCNTEILHSGILKSLLYGYDLMRGCYGSLNSNTKQLFFWLNVLNKDCSATQHQNRVVWLEAISHPAFVQGKP